MDFGKYIHELLVENEMVIIPGFGAFVSEYKPAEINNDSGEINPPSKIITFNPQIKNNDGLLVGYVAEKRRSSHFDALKGIEKEREDILYKLDNGEQVELTKVGVLFYSEGNRIEFKAHEDDHLFLDSFGLEATEIQPIKEPEDDGPLVADEPEPESEEENTEKLESEPIIAAPVPPVETEQQEEVESLEEDQKEVNPEQADETESENIQELKIRMAEPMPEKQKKKGVWWWLLILLPLIAVSVFVFLKGYKDGKSDKEKDKESGIIIIEEPPFVPEDTIKTDSIIQDSVENVALDTTAVVASQNESEIAADSDIPKYYLVGGSFSVEENAETFLNELKAKGLDAFHVGKKGRFYIVGIGTYNSFREAEQAKKEYMANNPGSEVWVYKK